MKKTHGYPNMSFSKLTKTQKAALLILYEAYPNAVSIDEILETIKAKGLDKMTHKQLDAYKKALLASERN